MPRPLRHTCSAQRAVRESRWSRVTSLGSRAMPSMVVALRECISTTVCAFAESADAQPHTLATAAAVRVPMRFAGSVTVLYSGLPRCDPFHGRNRPSCRVSGPSRIPSLDPLWSGKRRILRKRDQTGGSDKQRAADDHRRCFADPPGQTWLRSINQLKRPTGPPNSRDGTGRDARRGSKYLPK